MDLSWRILEVSKKITYPVPDLKLVRTG